MTTVNAMANPFSGLVAIIDVRTAVMTTVIGPVGSEMSVGVPPNIAANKPTRIAPYSPATGPAPEATPKASAIGKETTAAVKPPKISPLRVFRLKVLNMRLVFLSSSKLSSLWDYLRLTWPLSGSMPEEKIFKKMTVCST